MNTRRWCEACYILRATEREQISGDRLMPNRASSQAADIGWGFWRMTDDLGSVLCQQRSLRSDMRSRSFFAITARGIFFARFLGKRSFSNTHIYRHHHVVVSLGALS